MKIRESGMPEEEMWSTFFNPELIFDKLGFTEICKTVVEFGCGYGTFTLPAAKRISGTIYAFDIEDEMVKITRAKVKAAGLKTVQVILRDFVTEGTGLPDSSVNYVMLFNILHADDPVRLLLEAFRVLIPGGRAGIIHWNYDPSTPRGPSMEIRPRSEQCQTWAKTVGFLILPPGIINLPPFHYGLALEKTD